MAKLVLLFVTLLLCQQAAWASEDIGEIKVERASFPKGFVFGTATAAYQYEGAYKADGKGQSIWDVFTHEKGKIKDNENGDVAVDQYHRFKEDIWLLKDLNMDAYRFSISWPRILPNGTGATNWEGVRYYNKLINNLIAQGIEPYVTLYHWDLPQALDESIGGWLSPEIVDAFGKYARLCFELFGDRVKHWITFNEIHSFAGAGYYDGTFAPGRCSSPYGNCHFGDSLTEPYIVAHHALNSHALAVDIYRKNFQSYQKGIIGITADCTWYEPLHENSATDKQAAQESLEGFLGWFLDPIFFGDYPASMRKSMGSRLPYFTAEETKLIKGSQNFVGINHYTSNYATFNSSTGEIVKTAYRDGVPIGTPTPSDWLFVRPKGMSQLLGWVRERYNNPIVYITENGRDEANNEDTLPLKKQLEDPERITYYHGYLKHVLIALREGSDIRGYFAWSLMDNFEWANGFTVRFGIYYVDYKNNLARYPKSSVFWFQKVLKKQ